jgi:hypothetical protein
MMAEQSPINDINFEDSPKAFAFSLLREWLCCGEFKNRAPLHFVIQRTELGRQLQDLQEKEGWQWYKTHEGRNLKSCREELVDIWIENKWVKLDCPRLGRRRVVDYNLKTLGKAMRIWGDGCQGFKSDSTWKWAASVLGENCNRNEVFLVTVVEQVFEELYGQGLAEDLKGFCREEVARFLGLPKRVANHFVRYLVETHGWSVKETTRQGLKIRVLRKDQAQVPEKDRTIQYLDQEIC